MTESIESKQPSIPEEPPPSDTKFNASDRFLAILGIFLAILGLLAALVTLSHRILILWIVLAAAVIIALLPLFTPLRQYRYTTLVYAILCAGLIIGFNKYIGSHNATRAAGLSAPTVGGLHFAPSPGTVPWCWSVTGDGVIPAGYSLLIFDSPATDSRGDLLRPILYGFQGVASQEANANWTLRNIRVLDQPSQKTAHAGNQYDEIFGVVMTAKDAKAIASIEALPAGSYWRSRWLPVGIGQVIPLVVQRNNSFGSCQ
jgi:hypothetical protein